MAFEKGNKDGKQFNSESAKKAQKKAVRNRYKNKHGRELLLMLLQRKCDFADVADALKKYGFTEAELTNEVALYERQMERAMRKGDTKAFTAVMKTAGLMTEETHAVQETHIKLSPLTKEEAAQMKQMFDEDF